MLKGHEFKETYLRPSQVKIDYSYQRQVNEKKIAHILNTWNYDLVNMPKISQRIDGSYYAFDGQATLTAWKRHENDAPIKCKVYTGLSKDEEVELFLQQFGGSTPVSATEKAKARYNRKGESDLDVVGTVDTARLAGVTISFYPTQAKNSTNAVEACIRGYKRLGAQKFSEALSVLKDAWDGDHNAFGKSFINGIVELFSSNYGEIDRARLVRALAKNSPGYYVQRAKDIRGNAAKNYALVFAMAYNATKHSQKLNYTT